MSETLDPRALCTPTDVKEFAGGFEADELDHEDLLVREINAVSAEIHVYAEREFVAANATGSLLETVAVEAVEREFTVVEDVYVDDETRERVLIVGDLAAKPARVEVKDYDGTSRTVADAEAEVDAAIVLEPRRRLNSWEPFDALRFRRGLVSSIDLFAGQTILVTALWGFPEIPATIRKAAYTQASLWYARDVRHYATVFNLETGRYQARPRPLDDAIRAMVDEFKFRRV